MMDGPIKYSSPMTISAEMAAGAAGMIGQERWLAPATPLPPLTRRQRVRQARWAVTGWVSRHVPHHLGPCDHEDCL